MNAETPLKNDKKLSVFAPAKINLFLHLTRKKQDGYHALQSLVSFADIGDEINIKPAEQFSFSVKGPFARNFKEQEKNTAIEGTNLAVKAARALSQAENKALNVDITLTKNLPLAAGIGGGSADAAAVIWGLQQLWETQKDVAYLLPMLTKLGADVPVCMRCQPTLVEGIGEKLLAAPDIPEIPILLINPLLPCPTEKTFLHHDAAFKDKIKLPDQFIDIFDLVEFLRTTSNDLYEPAAQLVPEIGNVINALEASKDCLMARMTGSGASCFALFETMEQARIAEQEIMQENSDWWVKAGWLNRPERY